MTGQLRVLVDVTTVVVQVTFLVSALFTPAVSWFWPWWQHHIGRTVAAEAAALALLTMPACLHFWVGLDSSALAFQWLEVACLAAVPVILIWRAITTYTAQRDGARRSRASQEDSP